MPIDRVGSPSRRAILRQPPHRASSLWLPLLTVALLLGSLLSGVATASIGTFNPPHTDYGLDTDTPPDGLYDFLVVNVSLSITEGGSFLLTGSLYASDETLITTAYENPNLGPGNAIVKLNFNGLDISKEGKDGPYRVNLTLRDTFFVVLDTDIHWTQPYLASDFQIPRATLVPPHSDTGVDTDGNSKFDLLAVDVNVKVNVTSDLRLRGNIYDSGETVFIEQRTVTGSFDVGDHVVRLNFTGFLIYDSGIDGPYLVKLWLYDASDNLLSTDSHATNPYAYTDFEVPPATLAPPHSDFGLDLDGNSLYDYLVVAVSVDVVEAGTFTVEGELWEDKPVNPRFIAYTSNQTYLTIGATSVWLHFPGSAIWQSGINGPYVVYLQILDDGGTVTSAGQHLTGSYNSGSFDTLTAYFSPPHSDFGLDTDVPANGLYDYLVVNASLSVRVSQAYMVRGILWNGAETALIGVTENTTTPPSGSAQVPLWFDGVEISNSSFPGPYVTRMYLFDPFGNLLNWSSHTTAAYSPSDFEQWVPPDATPPSISGVTESPDPQDVGLEVNISAVVTDDTGVLEVRANVTDPLGQFLGSFAMSFDPGGGRYYLLRTYGTVGTYAHLLWAVDLDGNSATYAGSFAMVDRANPVITDVTAVPSPQEVFGNVNVSAIVTDNYQLQGVWLDVSGAGNFSMSYDPAGGRYYDDRPYAAVATHPFVMWASDSSGNWASASGAFTIRDSTPPTITDATAAPNPQEVLGSVNVSAVVSDNYQLQGVWANISGVGNFSMSYDAPADRYYDERSYAVVGIYSFVIWASDSSGNWASAAGAFTVQDSALPLISDITAVPNPQEVFGSVNVSAVVTDNDGVQGVWMEIAGVGNFSMSYDALAGRYYHEAAYDTTGTYTFLIWALDTSGNWASAPGSFTVLDSTPPSISDLTVDPTPQEVFGTVNVSAVVSDNYQLQSVWLDVAGVGNLSMAYDPGSGRHYLERSFDTLGAIPFALWAEDSSGNWNSTAGEIVVQDSTPPSISDLTVVPPEQQVGGIVNVSAVITDNHVLNWTRIEVLDPTGAPVADQPLSFDPVLSRHYLAQAYSTVGEYTFNITAADLGGMTAQASGSFNVTTTASDVTPPTINSHGASPDPQEVHGTVAITASVTDDIAVASVMAAVTSPTGADLGNLTMTFDGSLYRRDGTYDELGTYVYCLWAEDTSGNGAEACGQFAMEDTTAPAISDVLATPSPQEVHLDVNVSAVITDNHLLQDVWVEVGDPVGQVIGNFTMSFDPASGRHWFTRAYSDLGTHTLTITAWDSSGNAAASAAAFEVRDTVPPVADAGPDVTIGLGETVTLDGTASSDNDAVENHTWTFSDGPDPRVLYGPVQAYAFENGGAFTVTLTVRDRAGNPATDTMTVTVIAPPMPPTGLTVTREGSDALRLTWTAPTEREDGSALLNLAGYEVYRSTSTGPPYVKVSSGLVSGTTFADSGLQKGVTYYYVVRAVDTESVSSVYSSEAFGAIPAPGSIAGRVLDETLQPLRNVRVALLDGNAELAAVTTDELGMFSFADVDVGSYTLRVTREGYESEEVSVVVEAGGETNVGGIVLTDRSAPPVQEPGISAWLWVAFVAIPVAAMLVIFLLARRRAGRRRRY